MSVIDKMLNWNLFVIGDTQTTLGSLLGVVAIVLGTMILVRIASRATTRFFERLTSKGDKGVSAYGSIVKVVRPGDLIIVDNLWLIIKEIGVRTTKANTYDGQEVLIPNSKVTNRPFRT